MGLLVMMKVYIDLTVLCFCRATFTFSHADWLIAKLDAVRSPVQCGYTFERVYLE